MADMPDAAINQISSTTFVKVGLQTGVLWIVLDPINGQPTDTRTQYVVIMHLKYMGIIR